MGLRQLEIFYLLRRGTVFLHQDGPALKGLHQNYQSLEVVSRCRDQQLQVTENYSDF